MNPVFFSSFGIWIYTYDGFLVNTHCHGFQQTDVPFEFVLFTCCGSMHSNFACFSLFCSANAASISLKSLNYINDIMHCFHWCEHQEH